MMNVRFWYCFIDLIVLTKSHVRLFPFFAEKSNKNRKMLHLPRQSFAVAFVFAILTSCISGQNCGGNVACRQRIPPSSAECCAQRGFLCRPASGARCENTPGENEEEGSTTTISDYPSMVPSVAPTGVSDASAQSLSLSSDFPSLSPSLVPSASLVSQELEEEVDEIEGEEEFEEEDEEDVEYDEENEERDVAEYDEDEEEEDEDEEEDEEEAEYDEDEEEEEDEDEEEDEEEDMAEYDEDYEEEVEDEVTTSLGPKGKKKFKTSGGGKTRKGFKSGKTESLDEIEEEEEYEEEDEKDAEYEEEDEEEDMAEEDEDEVTAGLGREGKKKFKTSGGGKTREGFKSDKIKSLKNSIKIKSGGSKKSSRRLRAA
jgi:hypothetical protein